MQSKVLVCGAGGFIGNHLVTKLKNMGYYVIGADLKHPEFCASDADEFYIKDLTIQSEVNELFTKRFHTVFQLAADMGGAGYISTELNDANVMRNSLSININICSAMLKYNVQDVLFTSSACVYPEYLQDTDNIPTLEEHTVYPASPDSEYGWEKLISERLYINHAKNHNFRVRIARLHNVFGPLGTYQGGKEKAPAALCRKVATGNRVEIWGDGQQQRSFLYIDQCIEGIIRLHQSDCNVPLNIGSERTVTINELVDIIATHSNRRVNKIHVDGPQGVRSRTGNNSLVNEKLNWVPDENLEQGLYETYNWIQEQIANDE